MVKRAAGVLSIDINQGINVTVHGNGEDATHKNRVGPVFQLSVFHAGNGRLRIDQDGRGGAGVPSADIEPAFRARAAAAQPRNIDVSAAEDIDGELVGLID